MSWILGIDFDTKAIHCTYLDEDGESPPYYVGIPLTGPPLYGKDAFTRTRQVRLMMTSDLLLDWDEVIAVGIEHPAGAHGSQVLMRVQGAILSSIPTNVLVQDWPPARWRKAVGLKGNASKQEIADWVNSQFDGFTWLQDACDAYCIALATKLAVRVHEKEAA